MQKKTRWIAVPLLLIGLSVPALPAAARSPTWAHRGTPHFVFHPRGIHHFHAWHGGPHWRAHDWHHRWWSYHPMPPAVVILRSLFGG